MQKIFTSQKSFIRLLLLMAAAPLGLALLSQYGFGLHPCELCIYQRIPYGVIIFFSIIALIFTNDKTLITSVVISIHALLASAAIAFYHVGVEKNWWVNEGCSSKLNMNSIEELKKSIMSTPAVKCNDIQFEMLGISMAGWNFLYTLAAAILVLYGLVKYIRFRKSTVHEIG